MDDYLEYLKKYAEKHGISEEEAEKHKTVQNAKKYYEEKDSITVKEGQTNGIPR